MSNVNDGSLIVSVTEFFECYIFFRFENSGFDLAVFFLRSIVNCGALYCGPSCHYAECLQWRSMGEIEAAVANIGCIEDLEDIRKRMNDMAEGEN